MPGFHLSGMESHIKSSMIDLLMHSPLADGFKCKPATMIRQKNGDREHNKKKKHK